jgi:hypothetical protein
MSTEVNSMVNKGICGYLIHNPRNFTSINKVLN